jgi:hypothetical protein
MELQGKMQFQHYFSYLHFQKSHASTSPIDEEVGVPSPLCLGDRARIKTFLFKFVSVFNQCMMDRKSIH